MLALQTMDDNTDLVIIRVPKASYMRCPYCLKQAHNCNHDVKPLIRLLSTDRLNCLTTIEMAVAAMVTVGLENKEIAAIMHRDEKTIKTHISDIYRKTRIVNRAALAAIVALSNHVDIEFLASD